MKKKQRDILTALALGAFAICGVNEVAAATDYLAVNSDDAVPVATGTNSLAVGPESTAEAVNSIAIGNGTGVVNVATYGIAVGTNAKVSASDNYSDTMSNSDKRKTSGQTSVAIGVNAETKWSGATAVGAGAKVNGLNASAFGNGANAVGENSIAFGGASMSETYTYFDTIYNMNNAIAVGKEAYVGAGRGIAIGLKTKATGIASTALGAKAEALGESDTAIGNQAHANGWGASAFGTIAKADGLNATAIGNDARAQNTYAVALGSDAIATAVGSTSLGTNTQADGRMSTSLGYNVQTSGLHGISIGTNTVRNANANNDANAGGDYAISMGSDTHARNTDSIAIGRQADSTSAGGIAIGAESFVEIQGGVALGNQAIAIRYSLKDVSVTNKVSASENEVYGAEKSSATDKTSIAGTVKGNYGAVSVDNDDGTRQITNVAAGSEDSDAVNVAQLRSVENDIGATVKEYTDGYTTIINKHTNQINDLNNRVDDLDGRVNTVERDVTGMKGEIHDVGAMSAALAGLRNLAFDPSSKLNFSVAGGFYREASAMALGASYQPNEDVLLAFGTSVGNNDNMYNVSATFKIGPSEKRRAEINGERMAPISTVYILNDQMTMLKEDNQKANQRIDQLAKENEELRQKLELFMTKLSV